jgi:hypothetical protein
MKHSTFRPAAWACSADSVHRPQRGAFLRKLQPRTSQLDRVWGAVWLPLSLAVWLSACGGGGGGAAAPSAPPPAPPLPSPIISSANYEGVAREFGALYSQSMAPYTLAGSVTGAPSASPPLGTLGAELTTLGRRAAEAGLNPQVLSSSTPVVSACKVSGSLSLSWTDADNNKFFSQGDSIVMQAKACKQDAQQAALDGSLAIQVQNIELAFSGPAIVLKGYDFSLSMTQLGFVGSPLIQGSARLQAQGLSTATASSRITFNNVTVAAAGQAGVVNNLDMLFRDSADRSEQEINGSYTRKDVFTLRQLSPFIAYKTPYPTVGALRIQDSLGAAVVLRARADMQVDVEHHAAGASVPTTVKTMAWKDLLALLA